jgi:hypothetical protein
LAATTLPRGVRLTWAVSSDLDRAYTEIWRAVTNDRNTATRIAITDGNSYDHTGLSPLTQGYYWVRDVNFSRIAGGFNPTSATGGILGIAGFVQANDLAVGQLDAITANMGTLTAGSINLASDPAGTGWGYLRSLNKWWQDGLNGWVMARLPSLSGNPAQTLVELRAASNTRLELYNNGVTSYGVLQFPNFYVDSTGYMQVDAVDVIKTLNLQGQAVTIPVGASSGTASVSAAINSSGAPIAVIAFATTTTSGPVNARLYVDGGLVASYPLDPGSGTNVLFAAPITTYVQPGAGVHTFTWQIEGGTGGMSSMVLLETKR